MWAGVAVSFVFAHASAVRDRTTQADEQPASREQMPAVRDAY
jgi:hypothetical protein